MKPQYIFPFILIAPDVGAAMERMLSEVTGC